MAHEYIKILTDDGLEMYDSAIKYYLNEKISENNNVLLEEITQEEIDEICV